MRLIIEVFVDKKRKNQKSWFQHKKSGELIIYGELDKVRLHCQDEGSAHQQQMCALYDLEDGKGHHYAFQAGTLEKIYVHQKGQEYLVFQADCNNEGCCLFYDLRVNHIVDDSDERYINSLQRLDQLDVESMCISGDEAQHFMKLSHLHRWSI